MLRLLLGQAEFEPELVELFRFALRGRCWLCHRRLRSGLCGLWRLGPGFCRGFAFHRLCGRSELRQEPHGRAEVQRSVVFASDRDRMLRLDLLEREDVILDSRGQSADGFLHLFEARSCIQPGLVEDSVERNQAFDVAGHSLMVEALDLLALLGFALLLVGIELAVDGRRSACRPGR